MRVRRWLLVVGIVILIPPALIAVLLAVLWFQHTRPVTLPAPSGPYAVGRMDFDWVDAARRDPFAPETLRELTVWIWYPAAAGTGNGPADYLPPPLRAAVNREMPRLFRNFLTHDLSRVHAHAMANAAIATDKPSYPLLLLKPGLGALALDYTTLAEDLASHGYVVVASDSPHSTWMVVYRDGRIARRTAAGHPADEGRPAPPQSAIEKVLRVWVDDERFLLGKLGGMFGGRVDLTRVGAFGHSFGGATALQFCFEDTRCKAAVDVDGIPFGDVSRAPVLTEPSLILLSDHSHDRGAEGDEVRARISWLANRLPNRPAMTVLNGTRHFNFSDQALTKNTRVAQTIGMLGPMDARRALTTASDTMRAFFDRYLGRK